MNGQLKPEAVEASRSADTTKYRFHRDVKSTKTEGENCVSLVKDNNKETIAASIKSP